MKTTIEMAREAGYTDGELAWHDEILERFAELVRADERKQIIAINAPEIERVNAYIKALEVAVEAEREQCAKVVEAIEARCIANDVDDPHLEHVAAAIRNRSNT